MERTMLTAYALAATVSLAAVATPSSWQVAAAHQQRGPWTEVDGSLRSTASRPARRPVLTQRGYTFDGFDARRYSGSMTWDVDAAGPWTWRATARVLAEYADPRGPSNNVVGAGGLGGGRLIVLGDRTLVRVGGIALLSVDEDRYGTEAGAAAYLAADTWPLWPAMASADVELGVLGGRPYYSARLTVGAVFATGGLKVGWRVAGGHPLAVSGVVFELLSAM